MTLSLFQEPPPGLTTSASTTGGPLAAFTFFSFPPAKNPIDRLSADQNGNCARSVPGSGRAVTLENGRTQSIGIPPLLASNATNVIWRPSGDAANSGTTSAKVRLSGG